MNEEVEHSEKATDGGCAMIHSPTTEREGTGFSGIPPQPSTAGSQEVDVWEPVACSAPDTGGDKDEVYTIESSGVLFTFASIRSSSQWSAGQNARNRLKLERSPPPLSAPKKVLNGPCRGFEVVLQQHPQPPVKHLSVCPRVLTLELPPRTLKSNVQHPTARSSLQKSSHSAKYRTVSRQRHSSLKRLPLGLLFESLRNPSFWGKKRPTAFSGAAAAVEAAPFQQVSEQYAAPVIQRIWPRQVLLGTGCRERTEEHLEQDGGEPSLWDQDSGILNRKIGLTGVKFQAKIALLDPWSVEFSACKLSNSGKTKWLTICGHTHLLKSIYSKNSLDLK
ncbi:hypothetical protein DFJ73DRAFT_758198 [Zopfochytrium polystomum]|nr:hypothetical protein DFJ73DRAFT_758198 [Zopfochytrium polystomum]